MFYGRLYFSSAVLWNGEWALFVTESDLLAGVTPTPGQTLQDAPESAPPPDVSLDSGPLEVSLEFRYEHRAGRCDGCGRAAFADVN